MNYLNKEAVDWSFERTVGVSGDKLVLLTIARRANKYWAAFPGKDELSRITGLAPVSLTRSFKRLEDEGHMIRIAFAGGNRQEQRVGFVLAGCGRPLDALDEEFLALAFAGRKQSGTPLAAKPQHWSGERKGEGRSSATPPGRRSATPQGRSSATPRRKEIKEDEEGREDSAVAQAPDKSVAPSTPAAIAEVRAAAPTPNRGSSTPDAAKIPKQRQPRPSNEKRDANWRAQIVAADVDELDDVLSTSGHGKSARRMSSFRLGFGTRGNVPDELYPQYVRHAYLYLLKDVAETDPEHLDDLKYALDETVKAGRAPYKWDHTEHVPAGETVASFSARMIQVAASMPPEQLGPWAAEIEDFLPGLWYEKRHEARGQLASQGLPLEIETIASVAVRLMIQYYANKSRPKWPAEVVPPSMRTVALITEAPSWAA